ncbi:MAG: hypothetical protein HYV60_06225 [Planctomycetia bacterium]|nr:hypothetical protein [Planctomycetia bacterium]
MRTLTFLSMIAILHVSCLLAAEDSQFASASDDSHVRMSESSEYTNGGGVILDGHFIAAPYHVVAVVDGLEVNGHFVPEEGFNERSRKSAQSRIPFAERVRSRLDEGGWLLGWEEGEYGILNESRISGVLYALSSESPENEKLDDLEAIGTVWIERAEWRKLVERCELPASILSESDSGLDPALADPELVAAIAAPLRRFHMSIYLLTVIGIGATVFALGTLLSYRPIEKMPWSGVNLSKDATQLVLRSVILLIGLAVLDLVCTSISAQTASFWELNPLGAVALQSQVASWWLALFCTILAIRWVTFNSMFMA